ncbi:MFS transporter [Alicyclobacillus tolerans]|uniref:GPH family glycoside/pentoside/hexuronide:cation symporter n=1 Tax=Alicyclobacillus tolerans TaxID=90970 RepID=A0ABT9LYW2_9BACL|nr:MFS transporter [Alicyclobacillus tengchongensis]MDP9729461.1 GPH family glycoside/pentoside/hexuronide:cation symporter [Alicyclobacillus tengchongensis]
MANANLTHSHQIPLGKQVAYSSYQLGINMLWYAFSTIAVFFYVTVLKVSATEISYGMIVYGILNAFMNVLAGHWSDRTHTRLGRRIPYILASGLPFCLTFYFLFSPPAVSNDGLLLYFFLLTFLFDFCFTLAALNAGSLFPEMYQEEKSRAFVSALQQVFAIVGLILGVALSKSLGESLGWSKVAALFAGIAFVSIYVSLYGSFERSGQTESAFHLKEAVASTFRNRRFLFFVSASFLIQFSTTLCTSVSSFYTKYVVSMTGLQSSLFLGGIFIVAIPLSFLWARLAVKMTTAKAAFLACILYIFTSMALVFDHAVWSVILTGFMMGIPVSGFLVLLNILLAEVIDHDAKLTGRRREGMYLGMNGFLVRLGLSLQYAVMAIFFSISGYNAHLSVQSVRTIWGFRLLIGGLPVVALLVSLILLLAYQRLHNLAKLSDEATTLQSGHSNPLFYLHKQ